MFAKIILLTLGRDWLYYPSMNVPIAGTIAMFASDRQLRNWMPCKGQMLPLSQNLRLWIGLGEPTLVNSGRSFHLPDLKDPIKGVRYIVCCEGDVRVSQDKPQPAFIPETLGLIALWAGAKPPAGCLFSEGQLLDVNASEMLCSVLDNRFGGDGLKTFALPDLRGLASTGQRPIICVEGEWPSDSR
jgi:microcystin-dependent protein